MHGDGTEADLAGGDAGGGDHTSDSASVTSAFDAVHADARVREALADLQADDVRTFEEQKRIAEIPSPPFKEQARAAYVLQRLREAGLSDASIVGPEGYVIATRRGRQGTPKLVVSAHLDTVFPEGTDVKVTERDGVAYGPGICDDARGVAAVLAVAGALGRSGIETVGDVLFVGTVGEEGLGDLRGVKALFADRKDIGGFISVDGNHPDRITHRGTGSRRHEVTFRGPGGHSFSQFGLPSAVHAMGRAIAAVADIRPPAEPKTTFTVGVAQGGAAVNAIAGEARMAVDIRSNDEGALRALEEQILRSCKAAAADENRRWASTAITVDVALLGERPAGVTPADAPIVQVARMATASTLEGTTITLSASSTDANIAMALGIPAVTISGGGLGGSNHSLSEWYKPAGGYAGPQKVLLTLLTLVGVQGVSEPVLRRLLANSQGPCVT